MSKWNVVTNENTAQARRAKLMLERAGIDFKEHRVNDPGSKKPIVELIGDFKDYPQIYFMDEDFPVHIGGVNDLDQYLALNGLCESKVNLDELQEATDVRDFSCLEG